MQGLSDVNHSQKNEIHSLRILATVGLGISALSFIGNIALLILYLRKKAGARVI